MSECAFCGGDFEPLSWQKTRRFCSLSCANYHKEAKRRESAPARFWARVNRRGPNECWEWSGMRHPWGHGYIKWNQKNTPASRIAYLLTYGTLPDDMFVCHTCDNPPCCNPAHLFLGTPKDNVADMWRKGRQHDYSGVRGERNANAKLTEADVRVIRRRLGQGERPADIAADFPVSKSTIREIRRGTAWACVK